MAYYKMIMFESIHYTKSFFYLIKLLHIGNFLIKNALKI